MTFRSCAFPALALWAAACSSTPAGPHVLYTADPTSNQNPFPDARLFVVGDGGFTGRVNANIPFMPASALDLGASNLSNYIVTLLQATTSLTGFGNFGKELIPFSTSMNPDTLDGGFSYVLLGANAAKGSPARVTYNDDPPYASVAPSFPLQGGSIYGLVLTTSAQTSTGVALTPPPDYLTYANGQGSGYVTQAAQVLGISQSQIAFAMFFTTENARADVQSLASWTAERMPDFDADAGITVPEPAQTVCDGGDPSIQCPEGVFTNDAGTLSAVMPWLTQFPSADGGFQDPPTDVGVIVAGTVTLKDARDSESGHFQASVVQNPSTGRDADRAFVLVLPNPATIPMPPSGYPLALVGHGLGGRNTLAADGSGHPQQSLCVSLAEWFSQLGYGCIGIDAPSEGTRGPESEFFDFGDLTVTRDNFREMAFDQLQVMRLASSGLLSQFGPPIDPNNLRYFGISLGGIMGSTFLTVDLRSLGGVLNVPGGGLTNIFESPNIFYDLGLELQGDVGIPVELHDGGINPVYASTIPFITTVAQAIMESADPINYAPALPASKHILIQEAFGDQTVPNNTNDDLTAAFGVPTLTSSESSDGGINGRWQFDVTQYGIDPSVINPHLCFQYVSAVRQQAGDYLQSDDTEIVSE